MLLRGWAYSVLRLLCRPRVAALLVPYLTCRKEHTQTCDRECRAARAAPGIALRRVEQRYAYKSKIPAYISARTPCVVLFMFSEDNFYST